MIVQPSILIKHPYLWLGWSVFILLALSVSFELPQLFFVDQNTLNYLSRFISLPRAHFFDVIAFTGKPAVTLLAATILIAVLWQHKQIWESLTALTMVLSGNAVGLLIKLMIQRPRPTSLITPATGYSFPSGHVISSVILAIVIFKFGIQLIPAIRLRLSLSMLLIFWLGLVALSQLYLQVHYPSDVLGGALFAFLWCETVMVGFQHEFAKVDQLVKDKGGIDHES